MTLPPHLVLTLFQATEAAPTTSTPSAVQGLSSTLIPMVLVGALFVFMLILPERKKQKQRQAMLSALKKGDRVLTASGIYGTVVTSTNEAIVLQVADNVRMRFARVAIQTVLPDENAEKSERTEEKAEPSKA